MKNKKRCLLFTFLFLSFTICFAQTQSLVSKNNVISPSPTASSLGKYAEWPVSLYTGTPQIGIPLYTLQSKNTSIPVSLNYHASGIKVDEYASWVGLGWSLNAGGVITRTVRGLPDDQPANGYFDARTLLRDPGNGYDNVPNFIIYHQQALGVIDSQPDVFMFNAMGQSFKFFIDSNYNVQSIPKSAVKISFLGSTFSGDGQWVAQLEDGTKLYFGGIGAVEKTENSSNYVNDDYYTGVGFVSSWYLKKVVPSVGPEVNFQYLPEDYAIRNTLSVTDYHRLTLGSGRGPETNVSQSNIHGIRLSSVQNENQIIKFIAQPLSRNDLSNCYALDSIKVYELNNLKLIKQFKFNYSYTFPNSRLILNDITESSVDHSISYSPWKFTYSELLLPARGSFSQDHWGYYNGANNQTLLPYAVQFPITAAYGDRESHFPFCEANILKQINYPSGGHSKFTYEPHSYPSFTNDGPLLHAEVILETSDPAMSEKSVSFTKDNSEPGTINYYFIKDPNENDPLYIMVTIIRSDGRIVFDKSVRVNGQYTERVALSPGNYVMKIRNTDMSNAYCKANLTWKSSELYPVDKLVGGVRIKELIDFDGKDTVNKKSYLYNNAYNASPIRDENYAYNVKVLNIDPCIPAVGIPNILEIVNYVARTTYSKAIVGTTSGSTMGYGTVKVLFGNGGANGSEENTFTNSDEDGISNFFPFPPVTSFDYKRGLLLNQKIMDAGGTVKKNVKYTYNIIPVSLQTGYATGFLLYNHCYDGSSGLNVPIRSQIVYGSFASHSEWVQKTSQTEDVFDNTGNKVSTVTNYYYDNPAHMQVTRSISSKSDGKILTNLSTFADDYASGTTFLDQMKANHQIALPIEQVSYQEDVAGVKVLKGSVTKYKEGGKGLVDKVYELESLNPVTLAAFKFSNRTAGILPMDGGLSAFSPDSRYAEKLTYNEYDNVGNPLQITVKDGLSKSYKWGYNKQYPIVEALNAAPTEFFYEGFEETAGAVTGTAHSGIKYSTGTTVNWTKPNARAYVISYWYRSGGVWTFRSEQAYTGNNFNLTGGDAYDDISIFPSDGQLASYTYSPFIGMGSATDAKGKSEYYDYDTFQRLKNIRDQNKNIIKNYSYHYQSEITRTKYLSAPMSRVAVRNNCPDGYIGQSATYSLEEGKYNSYISQEAANQLALDDLNANTQTKVNEVASCLSACTGPDKKMVNGYCETGTRVNTGSTFVSRNNYRCTYHYEWSDGSSSVNYTENNSAPCAIN